MADAPREPLSGAGDGVQRLLARAAVADARAQAWLNVAVADVAVPAGARIDDRARAAIEAMLRRLIDAVAGELRDYAARLLRSRGESALADALAGGEGPDGIPDDAGLLRELIARVRLELLADALPVVVGDDPDRASLLPRLVDHPDRVVAASARAVLGAENRRRDETAAVPDLPAELHHALVWWTAAALRASAGAGETAALDRALTEAALRNLGAQDEGERLEAVASRLAAALDLSAGEYGGALLEALGDRRAALFVALLAHGIGVPFEVARDLVLEVGGERLWLACRVLDLPRDDIAQIGLRLAEADPRRDLEGFADALDDIVAITPAQARTALARLWLHPDYRAAIDARSGIGR